MVSRFHVENSEQDKYKIKKIRGKPKLVKDGKNCVVKKNPTSVGRTVLLVRAAAILLKGPIFPYRLKTKALMNQAAVHMRSLILTRRYCKKRWMVYQDK